MPTRIEGSPFCEECENKGLCIAQSLCVLADMATNTSNAYQTALAAIEGVLSADELMAWLKGTVIFLHITGDTATANKLTARLLHERARSVKASAPIWKTPEKATPKFEEYNVASQVAPPPVGKSKTQPLDGTFLDALIHTGDGKGPDPTTKSS